MLLDSFHSIFLRERLAWEKGERGAFPLLRELYISRAQGWLWLG